MIPGIILLRGGKFEYVCYFAVCVNNTTFGIQTSENENLHKV